MGLKVDAIVTRSATDTRAAKAATVTIPIVMTNDGDPVGNGFINSLAKPSGNITGLSTLSPGDQRKAARTSEGNRYQVSRVSVFGTSTSASNARELREVELAAAGLAVKLQYFDVLAPKDIEPAFRSTAKERSDVILMNVSAGIMGSERREMLDLAVKSRLP